MRRALLGTGAAVAVLLAAFVVVAAWNAWNLLLGADGPGPSRSTLPEPPRGLSIENVREECGSGGCHLAFDVVGAPGESGRDILARLPEEPCERTSLLDWRTLCVDYELDGDDVRGSASYGNLLA